MVTNTNLGYVGLKIAADILTIPLSSVGLVSVYQRVNCSALPHIQWFRGICGNAGPFRLLTSISIFRVFRVSDGEVSVYDAGDLGSIPGLGRSLGEGNDNPLQYYCLGNPMDRGAW